MKIDNNKIVEANENELFAYYLKREMDDIMSFPDYIRQMKCAGVVVTDISTSEAI